MSSMRPGGAAHPAEIEAEKTIGKSDIEEIVAKIARIPSQHVSVDDRSALKTSTAT